MNATSTSSTHTLRPQLIERRTRLQRAARSASTEYVTDLLDEIDSALQRMDAGTFGICESCHESIEADRLEADPLARFCLDHLSGRELQAHQQDLDLAAEIQSRLLPPCDIRLESWETHYRYQPAGPVGGDYCELVVPEGHNSLFFAVGDISGKGVAASLLMTHLNAILRSLVSLDLPLTELTRRANRLFCESTLAGHYATLVCGRATAGSIELSNAGHCRPLLLRQGDAQVLDTAGLPLGLFCRADYPVTRISMSPGDSLILYSDGITEAQDMQANQFGEDRLRHSLLRHSGGDAKALAQAVMEDVTRFRGGARPTDDLTLLILQSR